MHIDWKRARQEKIAQRQAALRDRAKDISTDSTKNVAVAAGVVSIAASALWFYRVNRKIPVEEDKE
jgi:hypothetical protein